jgi:hypothetical protein
MKELKDKMNPTTTHLEFYGTLGCLSNIIMMPSVAIHLSTTIFSTPSLDLLLAAKVYASWFAFQIVAYILVPGYNAKGVLLRDDKTRLDYKINAFRVLVATHVALGALLLTYGPSPLVWVADHVLDLT